tara:strand:- start:63 stop:266 length:204 start_codon:yes stop_codon:yes gene_type:complete
MTGSGEKKMVPIKARRCPMCAKPTAADFKPFCSKRCADLDLGRWLKEGYRIASEDEPDLDDEPFEED